MNIATRRSDVLIVSRGKKKSPLIFKNACPNPIWGPKIGISR